MSSIRPAYRSMMPGWAMLGLLLTALAMPAAAAQGTSGPERGDLVRVTVYGQEDLTTLARVGDDNMISFPFIGQVQVGGVSTAEAQSNIASALDRQGIVRNPQVGVLVESESTLSGDFVTILGEVDQPGRYSLGEGSELGTSTVLDLLAVAGGASEEAGSRLVLFRKAESKRGDGRREIDLNELLAGGTLDDSNLELIAGDVVIVPKAEVFYIYGQVNRPGRYPLDDDMMVMHAISIGGGVTERGNRDGVVLTRRGDGGQQRHNAALDDAVQAGDVIYVKERFF